MPLALGTQTAGSARPEAQRLATDAEAPRRPASASEQPRVALGPSGGDAIGTRRCRGRNGGAPQALAVSASIRSRCPVQARQRRATREQRRVGSARRWTARRQAGHKQAQSGVRLLVPVEPPVSSRDNDGAIDRTVAPYGMPAPLTGLADNSDSRVRRREWDDDLGVRRLRGRWQQKSNNKQKAQYGSH